MTDFPYYDLIDGAPEPLSPMTEYLRDRNCPPGYVETRRKQELRNLLTEFKAGQRHPILTLMGALDAVLISSRHSYHSLRDLVKDPTSFKGFGEVLGITKDATPDQFQEARKTHINKLIRESLNFPYQVLSYIPKNQYGIEWVDDVLAKLDQPETRAIDIVETIAMHLAGQKGNFKWEELQADIKKQRHAEERDTLIHTNDRHMNGDLLRVMESYKALGWSDSSTRDQYQTQKNIELRRANEIIDAMEAWKQGKHPLLVMSDILGAVVENLDHRYRHMIQEAGWELESEERARRENVTNQKSIFKQEYELVSILLKQEGLRRKARDIVRQMHEHVVAYRGPESNPAFAAAIDAFIQDLVEKPQSSFRVLEGLALAMFVDGSKELEGIKATLREVEEAEQAKREANKPMGALTTQTETEIKERLTKIFEKRAAPEQPPEKLTGEIQIEPVGAGMIKPYPSDEDYPAWREELYGTVTARVTTYAITLVPIAPDKAEALAARVRTALEEIADVAPAFEIPFDPMSQPYERPYKLKEGYNRPRGYHSFESLYVEIKDGMVKIHTRLDLDDLWHFYYLMEDVIEPSQQIATAMNVARYAEARGMLLQLEDKDQGFYSRRGDGYSNRPFRPEDRLGLLDYHKPADYVAGMIEDTFSLYKIGEIGDEQFMHRLIVLSDHTMTGKLHDPSGMFPSWQRLITQQVETGSELASYGETLKDRVFKILKAMAGVEGEDVQAILTAFKEKVRDTEDEVRDRMRSEAFEVEEHRWDRFNKSLYSGAGSLDEMLKKLNQDFKERTGKDLNLTDNDADQDDDDNQEEMNEEAVRESRALAHRANLAFHAGEVGATTDRTWRGTAYVSRSPGSIWVRKEMPSALAPFVASNPRDMTSIIKSLGMASDLK